MHLGCSIIIQDGGLYTNIKTLEIDYSAVTEVNLEKKL